jgi:hypothetical protein
LDSAGWRPIPCIFGDRCGLDATRSYYAKGMNKLSIVLFMSEEKNKDRPPKKKKRNTIIQLISKSWHLAETYLMMKLFLYLDYVLGSVYSRRPRFTIGCS